MEAAPLEEWLDPPPFDAVLGHRFFEPPVGYAIGIGVWPVYLAIWYGTLFVAETLGLVPFSFSVVVAVGGLLVTSAVSVLATCVTAWRVPSARLRGHALAVSAVLLVAPLLGYLYFGSPPASLSPHSAIAPLGLDVFVEHALVTTGVLGPTIGFASLLFALLVLAHRSRLERTS